MSRDELLERLKALRAMTGNDPTDCHMDADQLLVDYIGDAEISAAYEKVEKWYE